MLADKELSLVKKCRRLLLMKCPFVSNFCNKVNVDNYGQTYAAVATNTRGALHNWPFSKASRPSDLTYAARGSPPGRKDEQRRIYPRRPSLAQPLANQITAELRKLC